MMKYTLLLGFLLLLTSCSQNNKPTWLEGNWKRINDKPNRKTFEHWNKNLNGLGFTLQKNDTVFKEILSIITINDTLNLKVEGVNEQPTLFKFTSQTKSSFTCENKLNEFPTKIEYKFENDTLKAIVSNNEFSIDFKFAKIN